MADDGATRTSCEDNERNGNIDGNNSERTTANSKLIDPVDVRASEKLINKPDRPQKTDKVFTKKKKHRSRGRSKARKKSKRTRSPSTSSSSSVRHLLHQNRRRKRKPKKKLIQ